ncbi:MAG: D-alanine--D-alanine ligase [Myxococcota bacterium]
MRVLVLHDVVPPGAPPDQVDALVQAEVVRRVLEADGHHVSIDTFRLDPAPVVAARPDVVFNLVESIGGDGRLAHLAPAMFELLGIPFTGSGAAALAVTGHKRLCKRTLALRGISVPEDFPDGGPAWIVKSLFEHASVGLDDSCVVGAPDVEAAVERLAPRMGGAVVAETYVDGRELNVSMLETRDGVRVLPLAEIAFHLPPGRKRIVGYAAKWEPGSAEWDGTPRTFDVPGIDVPTIEALCRRCWTELGLRGYVRVDLRVPADPDGTVRGEPVVLEINANPCLAPDAGFAAAVERGGGTLDDAVRAIVAAAAS